MTSSPSPLRLGIAGLGTVGSSVIELLYSQQPLLRQRCGRAVEVVAVSARDRNRQRCIPLSGITWADDALSLASMENVDTVVELIGGSDGIAADLCTTALQNGKHVVTANKALIATRGRHLAALAEANNAALLFEAAVAGGIPAIKTLKEGAAANRIDTLYGILNGTCNYILTTMAKTGASFADVLDEAQHLGYAEADPSADIDGFDTAHKLRILAAIAFGQWVGEQDIQIDGIRNLRAEDVGAAREMGFVIRLLGIARPQGDTVTLQVAPCLVPAHCPIGQVDDVFNAVVFRGDYVGQVILQGRGAGGHPTASSVVADILDIATGRTGYTFGLPVDSLTDAPPSLSGYAEGNFYMRFLLHDKPGAVAKLATVLGKHEVSIRSLHQYDDGIAHNAELVPLYLTTHRCREQQVQAALQELQEEAHVAHPPVRMRIEHF